MRMSFSSNTLESYLMRMIVTCLSISYSLIGFTQGIDPVKSDEPDMNIRKVCLFHDEPYEFHDSYEAQCSFIVPGYEGGTHLGPNGRYVPHDPECFDEQER